MPPGVAPWSKFSFGELERSLNCALGLRLTVPLKPNRPVPAVLKADQELKNLVCLDLKTNSRTIQDYVELHQFELSRQRSEPLSHLTSNPNDDETPHFAGAYARLLLHSGPSSANLPRFSTKNIAAGSSQEACWKQASLTDGFIAQQLTQSSPMSDDRPELVEQVEKLASNQAEVERSAYFAASDKRLEWAIAQFDERKLKKIHPSNEVDSGLGLAYWSALRKCLGVELFEAEVVSHRDDGRSVLIIGPPMSGKTTLALHALNAHPELNLLGTGTIGLAVDRNPSTGDPEQLLAFGGPDRLHLRVGSVLGTLTSNPKLEPLMASKAMEAADLCKNSNEIIWCLDRYMDANFSELFGIGRRDFIGKVVGVLYLNCQGFRSRALGRHLQLPLCDALLRNSAQLETTIQVHTPAYTLIASDEEELWRQQEGLRSSFDDKINDIVSVLGDLPKEKMLEVGGGVDFPALIAAVRRLLG